MSQITLDKSMFGGANHTQRPSHHKPPDINNPNTDNLNTSGEDKGKPGLSHPFLGIGPGPTSGIGIKIGKIYIVFMYEVSIARLIPIVKAA